MTSSQPAASPAAAPPDTARMPWPVTAAAFLAMAGYYSVAGPAPLLFVFAVGVVASYFFRGRIGDDSVLRVWGRFGLLILILLFNAEEPRYVGEGLGNVRSRNIFGQVYLAEFMIECWRSRPNDPTRARLIGITCAGLLFLVSSNTFEDRFFRLLTPPFIVFTALSFYGWRDRIHNRAADLFRWWVLAATLVLGVGFYGGVVANKTALTEWGNRIITDRLPMIETGMMGQPVLGELFNLRGSAERVLRIENFAGDAHLRGQAFDTYTQGRWSPGFMERRFRGVSEELTPASADRLLNSKDMRVTRMVNGTANMLLYAPLQAAAIDRGNADDMDWAPEDGGPIRSRVRAPYEYGVTVPPEDRYPHYQGLLATPMTDEYRTKCLRLPEEIRPRLEALARKITAGETTDLGKVRAIVDYLMTWYTYSLSFHRDTREPDPVMDFLFSEPHKGAHCEYFGSACVLLLRALNIPARYVTGYYAHETEGQYTVVRQKDAHAWVEAYVKGMGWITADATPGDGRPDADAVGAEWWRKLFEKVQDAIKFATDWIGDLGQNNINLIFGVLVVGGLAYAGVRYLRRPRPVGPPLFAYSSADARLSALVARFEAAFAKRGARFPEHRTYAEHLADLAASGKQRGAEAGGDAPSTAVTLPPTLIEAGKRFIRYYDAARFGGRLDEDTLAALETALREIEAEHP